MLVQCSPLCPLLLLDSSLLRVCRCLHSNCPLRWRRVKHIAPVSFHFIWLPCGPYFLADRLLLFPAKLRAAFSRLSAVALSRAAAAFATLLSVMPVAPPSLGPSSSAEDALSFVNTCSPASSALAPLKSIPSRPALLASWLSSAWCLFTPRATSLAASASGDARYDLVSFTGSTPSAAWASMSDVVDDDDDCAAPQWTVQPASNTVNSSWMRCALIFIDDDLK